MIPAESLQEVINLAKKGDRDAFRVLVDNFQGFLYRVAFRMVPSQPDAEDIVQEVFIKVWKNIKDYRPEIRLTTWLYKITMNQSLDYLKKSENQHRYRTVDVNGLSLLTTNKNPEMEYQQNEIVAMVYHAAEGLSPNQKAVFVLCDLESLSVEEVCTVLDMSPGNLKSNLYYARKAVQKKLTSIYEFHPGKL